MCDIYNGEKVIAKYKCLVEATKNIVHEDASILKELRTILNNYLGNRGNPTITLSNAIHKFHVNFPLSFNMILKLEYEGQIKAFTFSCEARKSNEPDIWEINYAGEFFKFNLKYDHAGINLISSENIINKFCEAFNQHETLKINID